MSVSLCRIYTFILNSSHLLWGEIYCELQQQLMRAHPGGTVEVILNLVFSDLTKDLSFSYIPLLPSCFSCMNKGHLKWFGFETKEGLWGMNPTHGDQLQCLFIPLLEFCFPLSLVFQLLWWFLIMAFTFDVICFVCYSFFSPSQACESKSFSFSKISPQPSGLEHQLFK